MFGHTVLYSSRYALVKLPQRTEDSIDPTYKVEYDFPRGHPMRIKGVLYEDCGAVAGNLLPSAPWLVIDVERVTLIDWEFKHLPQCLLNRPMGAQLGVVLVSHFPL